MASLVHDFVISFIQRHIITCKLHCQATLGVKNTVHLSARCSWPVDCDVTSCRKRKFSLLFIHGDRGRIEIDHWYGLYCRGWYCYPVQRSRRPAQLVLCQIAVPVTPAQTVSWLIPLSINRITDWLALMMRCSVNTQQCLMENIHFCII